MDDLVERFWRVNDGDCPGHFSRHQVGNRCIWSCVWASGDQGLLQANHLLPLEEATPAQVRAELEDVSARMANPAEAGRASAMLAKLAGNPGLIDQARNLLGELRCTYKEYTAFWSIPPRPPLMYFRARPGWGSFYAKFEVKEE